MQQTDGIILGNGRCYFVEGMPYELDRTAKSTDNENKKIPLHYISELNGPVYGFNNFAYDFTVEVNYQKLGNTIIAVCTPETPQQIFREENSIINEFSYADIAVKITDSFTACQDSILREIELTNISGVSLTDLQLVIHWQYEKRNLTYLDFDGSPFPMPKSVTSPLLYDEHVLIEKAGITFKIPAHKPMYDDWACGYGNQLDYAYMQERFLHVGTIPPVEKITDDTLYISLPNIAPTAAATAAVIFTFGYQQEEAKEIFSTVSNRYLKGQRLVPRENHSPAYSVESDNENIPKLLHDIEQLIRSSTSEQGGVLAQPVMYPMTYNRDLYGSAVFYYGTGSQAQLKQVINFLFVCQSKYKLQNAYDVESFSYLPPPGFTPIPSRHELAEVPSYLVLMARDYYRLTDDLHFMAQLFQQLQYNIDHQELSEFFTIPTQGDESYTNFAESTPTYSKEMTDSCFLYATASDFLAELSEKFGLPEKQIYYSSLAEKVRQAVESRMWCDKKQHYIFSRHQEKIDDRPAFDLLCHPLFFGYCTTQNWHAVKSIETVLGQLTNPYFQIVPGFNTCAGGDIGYLLYNLAKIQHPLSDHYFKLLGEFSSATGTFAEYYFSEGGKYVRKGGNLRPWESGINGYAIFQYLFGIEPNLQENTLTIRPHLPTDTDYVHLKNYTIARENLSLSIAKTLQGTTISVNLTAVERALDVHLFWGVQANQQNLILLDGIEQQILRCPLPTACQSSEYLIHFPADHAEHCIEFILK